jgi:transcriptional regulator with XRE-family HTH domain
MLKRARGRESRVQFARRLGLSYTFVRAMEHGQRFPSDKVLLEIAGRLEVDAKEFLLAAWCDRSPDLGKVLEDLGVDLPGDEVETAEPEEATRSTLRVNGHPRTHPVRAGESHRAVS